MADIRKKTGSRGTSYQVRYATKTGYAYKTFATRKEALAFRDTSATRKAQSAGSSEVRTVTEGLQYWLDVCKNEGVDGRVPVTAFTLKTYEGYRDHIIRYDWPLLRELTPPKVIDFRGWLLRNFSLDRSRKLLSTFHSMILELVRRELLTYDVAAGISIRSDSRYDEPVTIPTEKQVGDLLAAADRLANSKNLSVQETWKRYRPMLYLAVDSGMRPQEYLAVAEHHLTNQGVNVEQAIERGDTKISVPKTRAGRRAIPLSPETISMVRHYAKNHGVPAKLNKYGLVFPTASGRWQTYTNWRRRGFIVACEEAGLGEYTNEDGTEHFKASFAPYSLRHFYASMLIEQRTNLKRIQALMGHADIETTFNVYGIIPPNSPQKSDPL